MYWVKCTVLLLWVIMHYKRMPEWSYPSIPHYLHKFPNPLTISGISHKDISPRTLPYKRHVCHCISYSSSIYLLTEKSTIQCTLIITKVFFLLNYLRIYFPEIWVPWKVFFLYSCVSCSKGSVKLAGFSWKTVRLSGINDIMDGQLSWISKRQPW